MCLLRPEEKSHNCAAIVWTPFKAEDNVKGERVKFGPDLYPPQPFLAPKLQRRPSTRPQPHLLPRERDPTPEAGRSPHREGTKSVARAFPLGQRLGWSPCVLHSSASELGYPLTSVAVRPRTSPVGGYKAGFWSRGGESRIRLPRSTYRRAQPQGDAPHSSF